MRILRRLSLHSSIMREIQLKNTDPMVDRLYTSKYYQRQLTPEQQLTKYAYTAKPSFTPNRTIFAFCAFFIGVIFHAYTTALYKNELKTRNPYRLEEKQHSSLSLRLRRVLFKTGEHLQKNIFAGQLLFKTNPGKVFKTTEQILRYQQYKNYMDKKNTKYEFVDIGIMDKYPFPEFGS